jgi:signal transduction histidine kinase
MRDDGIGIPPEFLTLVFEPFVQADRELARTKGGLGLGLALVKGLVELHGGAVSAHSEGPGRGSEFLVTLPLAVGPAQPAPPPLPAAATRHLSILVIEDNLDEATSLRAALEVAGHRVEIALDGPKGIETARELRPDVVLCDIGLPRMDGYEVARAMRGDPALAAKRLIAVTGYARPEDVRAALEAGFDHHVAKPASMAELERAMSEPSARRQATRARSSAEDRTLAFVHKESVALLPEGGRVKAELAPADQLGALVSRASHDLRAPLRHIEAFSDDLIEHRGAELGEVGRQQVSKIQRARRRAQEIVDDLLTLWQVTSAELRTTVVDMTALAHQVLAELRQGEPGRIIDVHLEEGVTATGDAQLLQVLLQNLLGNAWKYTSKRPSARIEFGRAATPTGAEYFVRDDGEGFDMARAGKLFEPFERLHSKDEFEGTGLGLHIARRVVERHGGRAWIESALGGGTIARFTIETEQMGARARARP